MFPYIIPPTIEYQPVEEPIAQIRHDIDFEFDQVQYFNNRCDYFFAVLRSRNCEILNKDLISNFLTQNKAHGEIISTLNVIFNNFTYHQKTSLEVFLDDENKSQEELFINIILDEYSDENIEKFSKVNNWFINNLYQKFPNININIEFN